MIFNNIDFSDSFIVENISRSILPPISTKTVKISGKVASKFIKNELGELNIDVGIRIVAKDRKELQEKTRALATKLYSDQPQKLYLDDEPEKYYLAIPTGNTGLKKLGMTGATILSFYCPNSLVYGETKSLNIIGNIFNAGTYQTAGTITIEITEAIDHIEATLVDTGEYVRVDHDFIIGDTVTIDLENEMVYKNGFSIMEDCHLESDFFSIPTGEFLISVNTGNATLEFTERWL